jgi:hypothetical protein
MNVDLTPEEMGIIAMSIDLVKKSLSDKFNKALEDEASKQSIPENTAQENRK